MALRGVRFGSLAVCRRRSLGSPSQSHPSGCHIAIIPFVTQTAACATAIEPGMCSACRALAPPQQGFFARDITGLTIRFVVFRRRPQPSAIGCVVDRLWADVTPLHLHPITRPLECIGGAVDGGFIEVAADQHHRYRQAVGNAARDRHRGVMADVGRCGVGEHVQRTLDIEFARRVGGRSP
jgi:hypothetical protein